MKKIILILILIVSISCNTDEVINSNTQNSIDIYLAGSFNGQACYWKNNQIVLLNNGGFTSVRATKIFVTTTDVYVLGFGFDSAFNLNYLYWKNGVLTDLTDQFSDSSDVVTAVTDMDIVGNDVYFVGFTVATISIDPDNKQVYWKNNTKTIVKVFPENFQITQVKIKNFRNNIYITGYSDFMNSTNLGGYYKNGVFTPIPNSYVIDLSIKNDDIFVYGFDFTSSFYYNMTNNNTIPIVFNGNHAVTQLDFDNNDVYYSGSDNKIYKNGALIYTESDSVSKLKALDGDLYVIIGSDLIGSDYKFKINNITILTANGNDQLNDIFIFQN